ncbi:MAG: hypothetical protein MJ252_13495 [archaeon]|nr:hypothetical protein [archaeon]
MEGGYGQGSFGGPVNDIKVINEILADNEQFMSIIKNRVNGLRNVAESYQNNEYEESMVVLSYCKDLGVVNDFFNNALIKKDIGSIHLKSDQALRIFPLILTLSSSKYDDYFKTGIKAAWVVLKLFSDVIIDAKRFGSGGGVDLNREDKLRKYDNLVEYFKELRNNEKVHQNARRSNPIKDLDLTQFLGELDHFLKMSNM